MVSSQFLIFIALLSVSVLPQLSSSMYVSPYPVCTDTSFNSAGLLDISTMLYNCSKNIPGSLEPPRYIYHQKYKTKLLMIQLYILYYYICCCLQLQLLSSQTRCFNLCSHQRIGSAFVIQSIKYQRCGINCFYGVVLQIILDRSSNKYSRYFQVF